MLTPKGKLLFQNIIATGNRIGLINNSDKVIEQKLALYDWEEKFGISKTDIVFTDFKFIDFIVTGYYLKKDEVIFYGENFKEDYLITNKKDKIEIELKFYISDCMGE